jgi:VIT1/CCC1 family predicted Fe2+/Mn2+ transporter
MTATTEISGAPADEPQNGRIASKLNWLRAGVMGANDGIVSTAGMVTGVAGAAVSHEGVLIAGAAAVAAGAMSMAVGEYVSVSSQRDSERAEIERVRAELAARPADELEELAELVQSHGVDPDLARKVAIQLTKRDAVAAHARLELGIDPTELSNPWQAGIASMLAFVVGGLIPLLAILLATRDLLVPTTATAVVLALAITGTVSAHLGNASKLRAVLRTVGGGIAAMAITYGIGSLIGLQI